MLDGFPITENWLHKHKPTDTTNQRWEFNAIIDAYVGLLEWDQELKFPETLSLDEVRITGIKVKALKLCVCASAVVIASNIPLIGQNAENKAGLAKEVAIILENVKNNEYERCECLIFDRQIDATNFFFQGFARNHRKCLAPNKNVRFESTAS